MEMPQIDGRMEGWLYTIRHNRFGLQFSRKRYFVLHDNNLTSFKSVPSDQNEEPDRRASLDCCIRVTDNGRESFHRKLGASSPEEAAKWIRSLQDASQKKFPFPDCEFVSHAEKGLVKFNVSRRSRRKNSVDWTNYSSVNVETIAPDHWDDHPAIMAVGVIDGTSEDIFNTLMSLGPLRSEWDFCFYKGSVVEHLDGHTDIVNIQLYSDWLPWLMNRRDVLLRRYWRREEDGTYGGGYVVTPVNKGKQSLVKHMVAIDWRSWNLYMRPSSERSITIRVVERLAALREMFKAKQGHGFAEFVSGEFMQTKFSLSKINTLPFKKEAKRIDLELVKVEEMEKPSSARNSLMDLNDASDEFFDVPEPNESYEFDSLIENSPFSQGHSQVKANGTMMQMVGADWISSDKREDDLGGRLGGLVQEFGAKGGPEFFFIVNMQVPGSAMISLALYYMLKTPLEEHPLLHSFVNGDDAYRNSRFKLIPHISKGSWIVKQSVGKKACLVGHALEVRYTRGKNYLELDIDVGSSTVARGVTNLVLGYLNNLVIEMAFLIQANTAEELPELLLGTCRLNYLDVSKSLKER
ncbi:hypothetical protein Bca101_037901 [Brassica carinata]